MLKGEMYRPFILQGNSPCNSYCMGKIVLHNEIDDKNSTIQILKKDKLCDFSEGFQGYLFEDNDIPDSLLKYLIQSNIPFLKGVSSIESLVNNDVVEIISSKKIARVLYRSNSGDNALVVTNQCNCNCIMCPEPFTVRQNDNILIEKVIKLIELININTEYLCITGGEPTILVSKLFEILNVCKNRLPYTRFLLLTNARMFSYNDFTTNFNLYKPQNIILGIPLYGDSPQIHDVVTNTAESFKQTVSGIENLLRTGNKVEIRIVVSQLNYKYLISLSNFIIKNFPNVLRVNIMALEMLGNAVVNKDKVWISFEEIKVNVEKTAINLIRNGIETHLYNFPLCFIDESLWSITTKSISDYKVRYFDDCEYCKVKEKCGGFFNSTINLKELSVNPIV